MHCHAMVTMEGTRIFDHHQWGQRDEDDEEKQRTRGRDPNFILYI